MKMEDIMLFVLPAMDGEARVFLWIRQTKHYTSSVFVFSIAITKS